jgi:hypothetical protein
LEIDPKVGIGIKGMDIVMLGILTDGNEDTTEVLHIEGVIEKDMDGIGPMEVMDNNADIMGIPPVPLVDGIKGSTTMDETLGLNMV